MASPTALDYIAIKEVLAKYCISIDQKKFELGDCFVPKVKAKYPGPPFEGVNDLATLEKAIEISIAAVTTHHALTTQSITLAADGKTAEATSYFTCWHFGQGKWEGQQLIAWGRYEDSFVLVEGEAFLPGVSGKWLVEKRKVVMTNLEGEVGVMSG